MKNRRGGQRGRPYKYLIETPDRHGNVRLYYRPPGGRWVRLREKPRTAAFDAEYGRAVRSEATPPLTARRVARQGSLRWLCEQYYASAAFGALDERTTRLLRRRLLDQICATVGDFPFAQMEAKDVARLRDAKATNGDGRATPQAANGIVKGLRALFDWARRPEYALATRNPATLVPYLKSSNPDGFRAWTEPNALKYEARHLLGSKAYLALALFCYTGARLSDVARLGPGMEHDGVLVWTEHKGRSKTSKHHETPILPPLRAAIDAYYRAGNPRHMIYLATEQGKQYSDKGLGNWFSRQCRLAGLDPGLSAHGVRKLGAVRAVENGATEPQLMAIFGWETSKQALLYTRSRNRRQLEADGIDTLLRASDRRHAGDGLDGENKTGTRATQIVALFDDVASGATIRAKKL